MSILENIDAAIVAWKAVPPEEVDLAKWKCGSIHCFGGWLPQIEHFYALGVRSSELNGSPYVHSDYLDSEDDGFMSRGTYLGLYLFGDCTLFYKRRDTDSGTDWEVIERRLQRARNAELARLDRLALR